MQMNTMFQQGQFQQNQFQQQQIMPEPPRVISTKDHLYLEDALSWELTAMKKCFHFAREATDPEIQMALDRNGHMHLSHYLRLLNHTNPTNLANK